jgi:hypothetical protein
MKLAPLVALFALASCGGQEIATFDSGSVGSGGAHGGGGASQGSGAGGVSGAGGSTGTGGNGGAMGTGGTKGGSSDSGPDDSACASPATVDVAGVCRMCLTTSCPMELSGCLCSAGCVTALECTIACLEDDGGTATACQLGCISEASMTIQSEAIGLGACEMRNCNTTCSTP